MPNALNLTIATPDRVLFNGDVTYLHVCGAAGHFGVLVDHAPMIASLDPGLFEIRPVTGDPVKFTTTRLGFFEVVKNKASILLDAVDTGAFQSPAAT